MLRQVCALLALAAAALAPGAAAAGCDTRPTLRLYAGYDSRGQGDLKPDVKVVQSKLGIPDDGFYGPNTEARVIDYQDEMGLTQDGVVGPNTWAALCGDSEPSDPSGEPNCGSLDVRAPSFCCLGGDSVMLRSDGQAVGARAEPA